MDGIYIVEMLSDYTIQLVAYPTEKQCSQWIKETKKTNKYLATKDLWVTYYKFGEDFNND